MHREQKQDTNPTDEHLRTWGQVRVTSLGKFNFISNSMKSKILVGILCLVAGSLVAADSTAKEEVSAGIKKLGQQSNYSWKTTVEFGNFTGTTEGKAEKDGLVGLSMTFGENTTEAFLKAGKGAIKAPDRDWQSLAELEAAAGSEPGRGQFMARRMKNFKAPSDEAADILGKVKDIKKDGSVYSGDLTDEGAKDLVSFGGRRGPNAPEPKNAKGSVKFWLKDGTLSKYELKVQGTINFNGEDRDMDRTTTTDIKDVGTTKLEVPEAAQKKLS